MKTKGYKVVIIGVGAVGVTTAFCIINQGLCDELHLIDLNTEKVSGEVLDLCHSMEFMNRNIKVRVGSYDACADADIIVLTASAPMMPNENDRLAMLEKSKAIVNGIVTQVMATGFDGHFIVVSNPVDVMTYYAWKVSGLPSAQVMGSGTVLDTSRLRYIIGERIHVDPRSVDAFIIGEHGDSSFAAWSSATIGGKDIYSIVRDNRNRIGENPYDEMEQLTREAGWEIFNRKGNTSFGIAASVVGIIKTILYDENRILPISTLLKGQYGEQDIYISVPTVINREGAKEIVELNLTRDEMLAFKNSCSIIREQYKKLGI